MKQEEKSSETPRKPGNPPLPKQQSGIDIRINLLSRVAKQLKTVGTIAALLSIPLALTFLLPAQQPTAYPVEPLISPSPEAVSADVWQCRFGGGQWQEFPNSCADLCEKENQTCAQVVTPGCDCGEGQCWDGEKCILESENAPETMMEAVPTPTE